MSRWFRHYAGMARDDKLVRVAIKSGQTIERVVWLWSAILESAAEIDDGGRYDIDHAEIAYFLRATEDDIRAVEDGLALAGRVAEGAVVKWGDRQFKSDRSAARQSAYRERRRAGDGRDEDLQQGDDVTAASQDEEVTAASRHGDAPDTDTEAKTEEPSLRSGSTRARSKSPPARKRATTIPADWQPNAQGLKAAMSLGFTVTSTGAERNRFVAYNTANGVEMVDWDAAWLLWLSRVKDFGSGKEVAPKAQGPPASATAWLTEDDPRWSAVATRWRSEKGRALVASGSRNSTGIGAYVPAAWLAPQLATPGAEP